MNRRINSQVSTSSKKRNRRGVFILLLLMVLCVFLFLSMAQANKQFDTNSSGYDNYGRYYRGTNGVNEGKMGGRGDGATGNLAVFLLIAANLTVAISIILKGTKRLYPMSKETTDSLNAFNRTQKKYLMAFHYILNPIAICVAFVHYHLSTCRSILPDTALVLFLIIAILGLVLKYRLIRGAIYKVIYSLHCSWITLASMVVILTIGHATI